MFHLQKPVDALTRVGVTLSFSCCRRVAVCFSLGNGVQLRHSKLYRMFYKTSLQAIDVNIAKTSVQTSSWIPTLHKCRQCLGKLKLCATGVGNEFPCSVYNYKFQKEIRPHFNFTIVYCFTIAKGVPPIC